MSHMRWAVASRSKSKQQTKYVRLIDKSVYVIAILLALSNLPQFMKVWIDQEVAGVSFATWFLFAIFSMFWCLYGFLHGDKPVMFQSLLLMVLQGSIALGVVIYG